MEGMEGKEGGMEGWMGGRGRGGEGGEYGGGEELTSGQGEGGGVSACAKPHQSMKHHPQSFFRHPCSLYASHTHSPPPSIH